MRPHRASAQQQRLRITGLTEPVEVRRHPGARRMTLRVSRTSGSVIVTMPTSCDMAQAGTFLNTHLDWVRERLGNLPAHVPLRAGSLIPLRGVPHRVIERGACGAHRVVEVAVDEHGLPAITVAGDPAFVPRRLLDWLAREAGADLAGRVRFHAANLQLKPARITVRDQRSRWGSCSTTGTLSFSWRLILAPPFILDYVAAHEVAHLAEMNHGPRFWALVRKTMPRTEEAKLWLKRSGSDLHRFGA